MLPNSSKIERKNGHMTQILHLNIKKDLEKKKESIFKNIDFTFKINKLSYLDVKKKAYINFGFGKINITSNSNNDLINIFFHDSSLQLRFQGFISVQLSSLSLDINKKNCIKINKAIGLLNNRDNLIGADSEKILTDIYLYFQTKNDINYFFDSLIHI